MTLRKSCSTEAQANFQCPQIQFMNKVTDIKVNLLKLILKIGKLFKIQLLINSYAIKNQKLSLVYKNYLKLSKHILYVRMIM